MTGEKRNRLVAALTVNAIILIVILAAVVIYQLVEIGYLSRRSKEIKNQIEVYQTLTEREQNTLDYYKSEEGLLDLAYQYGFVFDNN